jgi:hypothetical protein
MGCNPVDLNASSRPEIQRLASIGEELAKKNLHNILKFINTY